MTDKKFFAKRQVAAILAAATLCVFLFSACEAPRIVDERPLVSDGEINAYVYYDDDAAAAVSEAANIVASTIASKEGVDKPRVKKYSDKKDDGRAVIRVISDADNLKYLDYSIKTTAEGLNISAGGGALSDAVNRFIKDYDKIIAGGSILPDADIAFEGRYEKVDLSLGAHPIGEYTLVIPSDRLNPAEYAAQSFCIKIEELAGAELLVENSDSFSGTRAIELVNEGDLYSYSLEVGEDKTVIKAGGVLAFERAFDEIINGADVGFKSETDDAFSSGLSSEFIYIDDKKSIGALTLAGTDISEYAVITTDEAGKSKINFENEKYSAEEFVKYIELLCGAKLEIIKESEYKSGPFVAVGGADPLDVISDEEIDEYGEETAVIKVKDGNLYLTGGYKRGCMYAVYSFIERFLGARFLAPGCEIAYLADSIDIPDGTERIEKSQMWFRDVEEKQGMNSDYSAKRKLNSYYHREMTEATGGDVSFIRGSSAFVHTVSTIYRLSEPDVQPCFSSEEVYAKAIDRIRGNLNLYEGDVPILSFTQNDINSYCTCEKCSAVYKEEGSLAGTIVRFVNRLADDIKDEHPNVKILTLAYMFATAPTKTAPRDNVIIQYCTLDACNQDAMDDISCANNREIRSEIDGWTAISKNTFIWLYTTAFVGAPRSKCPVMNFDALYDTYRYFFEKGISGVFNEGDISEGSYEFGSLRTYILSRLMWEEDMTEEEYQSYIREFILGYYGEAGQTILTYFDMLRYFAKDKHFAWAAQTNGMIDSPGLYKYVKETSDWFERLLEIKYSDSAFKTRVDDLYVGYRFISGM